MKYLLTIVLLLLSLSADYFTTAIIKDCSKLDLNGKNVSVGEVAMISGEENEMTKLYCQRLYSELGALSGVTLVEREKLVSILNEIALSESGLADDMDVQAGKILNVDLLVNLAIIEVETGTEMYCKVIEVKTSKILMSHSYRDFEEEQSEEQSKVDLQVELGIVAPNEKNENGKAQSIEPSVAYDSVYLNVSQAEKKDKIGYFYRTNIGNVKYNRALLDLRRNNPQLFKKIIYVRRVYERIRKNRALFSVFILNYPPLSKLIEEKVDSKVKNIILNMNKRVIKNWPERAMFVKLFIKENYQILSKDPVINKRIQLAAWKILKINSHVEKKAEIKKNDKKKKRVPPKR